MLIIREVLTAKPGQASKLAKLFKKVFGSDPNPETVFVRPTARVCVAPCKGTRVRDESRRFDGTNFEPANCLKTRRLPPS